MNISFSELVDNFALFDDWEERYRYLIDLGGQLPAMEDNLKTPASKVQGCMSQVWLVTGWDEGGRLTMRADSDAQIVRGLIAVLTALFAGRTREEILATDIEASFGELGLDQHLSPNRRNGFYAMVERIRHFAAGGAAAGQA
jgi:cysteine desulfuration protein SufE